MITEKENEGFVNLIIKSLDYGTRETLIDQVYKMVAQYPEAKFNLISASVGNITESDIMQASTVGATILAMDVGITAEVKNLAKAEEVTISTHRIIYSVLDEIKDMLVKNSPVKIKYVTIGQGSIKSVFQIKGSKKGRPLFGIYI